jgi:hypothetical protein
MRISRTLTALAATGLVAATTGAAVPASAGPAQGGCAPSWKLTATPAPTGDTAGLSGVSVVSAKDAWFAGDAFSGGVVADHPWVLRWNGHSFSPAAAIPQGPFETRDANLGGSFDSATDGWVLGNSQLTPVASPQYAADWDGSRWTITPLAVDPDPASATQPTLQMSAIASLSASDAWAAGSFYTLPQPTPEPAGAVIEHWDGTQWAIVPNPDSAASTDSYLDALTVVSPSDIWAVGGQNANGAGGQTPLVEHYNGTAWTVVPAPAGAVPAEFSAVSAEGPSDVWAVGAQTDPGTGKATGLVEHWNGTAWSVVTGLPPLSGNSEHPSSELLSVYAASPTDVWATVKTVLASTDLGMENFLHWDGTSWTLVPVPGPQEYGLDYEYTGIAGSGPNDIWATGYQTPPSGYSARTPLLAHLSCG